MLKKEKSGEKSRMIGRDSQRRFGLFKSESGQSGIKVGIYPRVFRTGKKRERGQKRKGIVMRISPDQEKHPKRSVSRIGEKERERRRRGKKEVGGVVSQDSPNTI